ncbi:hypothetical protein QBC45DRAFT_158975 [Copromyces sp. CBS 386.78]|nr:hypothetical protein QBC45DRAFT_158975 [Copromyces sp. CBS 386.78]
MTVVRFPVLVISVIPVGGGLAWVNGLHKKTADVKLSGVNSVACGRRAPSHLSTACARPTRILQVHPSSCRETNHSIGVFVLSPVFSNSTLRYLHKKWSSWRFKIVLQCMSTGYCSLVLPQHFLTMTTPR